MLVKQSIVSDVEGQLPLKEPTDNPQLGSLCTALHSWHPLVPACSRKPESIKTNTYIHRADEHIPLPRNGDGVRQNCEIHRNPTVTFSLY